MLRKISLSLFIYLQFAMFAFSPLASAMEMKTQECFTSLLYSSALFLDKIRKTIINLPLCNSHISYLWILYYTIFMCFYSADKNPRLNLSRIKELILVHRLNICICQCCMVFSFLSSLHIQWLLQDSFRYKPYSVYNCYSKLAFCSPF